MIDLQQLQVLIEVKLLSLEAIKHDLQLNFCHTHLRQIVFVLWGQAKHLQYDHRVKEPETRGQLKLDRLQLRQILVEELENILYIVDYLVLVVWITGVISLQQKYELTFQRITYF